MYEIRIVSETKQMEKMKMKTIRNLILVLALSVTVAIADDGHTNGGNRCDTCPPCTENCGGFAPEESGIITEGTTEAPPDEETSVFEYWSKVIFEMVG